MLKICYQSEIQPGYFLRWKKCFVKALKTITVRIVTIKCTIKLNHGVFQKVKE